jgi:F0F1-type ATP synthase assembly protein I
VALPEDQQRGIGSALSLGIEIAVGVGLGLWAGSWIDRKFGTQPFGMLIGALLGLAGGLYLVVKTMLRLNK